MEAELATILLTDLQSATKRLDDVAETLEKLRELVSVETVVDPE